MYIQKYKKRGQEEKGISNCNNIIDSSGINFHPNWNRRRLHNSSIIGFAGMENLSHYSFNNHCAFIDFFKTHKGNV